MEEKKYMPYEIRRNVSPLDKYNIFWMEHDGYSRLHEVEEDIKWAYESLAKEGVHLPRLDAFKSKFEGMIDEFCMLMNFMRLEGAKSDIVKAVNE